MSGFVNRSGGSSRSGSIRFSEVSKLGIKLDDLVIKNSVALGPTEAQAANGDYSPQEVAWALALADTAQKKFIPIFDKNYITRRDFLRGFALNSEIDFMLETICNDSIVQDETNYFAYLSNDIYNLQEKVVDECQSEFRRIYNRFGFHLDGTGWRLFRQFLIDGALAFEIVYDHTGKKIVGFKNLDAAFLRPDVKEENGLIKKIWWLYPDDPSKTRVLYDQQIIYLSYATGALPSRVSYLENVVRSFNILRTTENATVMWYLMNATWRVKMIVPVGTLSPQKMVQKLSELHSQYKEDVRITTDTGEVTYNGTPTAQYYKNYLFPSKQGEQINIENMQGLGPDIMQETILNYFAMKLKEDSKIPFVRFDRVNMGGQLTSMAASGIDREEIRFYKFLNRLRSAWQEILIKPLWLQMCLNHPELEKDDLFKYALGLRWCEDNIFKEARNIELLTKRVDFVSKMLELKDEDLSTGEGLSFIPTEFAYKYWLQLDPDIIKQIEEARKERDEKIKKLKENPEGENEEKGSSEEQSSNEEPPTEESEGENLGV